MTPRVDAHQPNTLQSSLFPIESSKTGELPVQKFLEVKPVTQPSLKAKNVVWLNRSDYIHLFGEDDSTKYVQIANQVFRAALAIMDQGCIGMTDIQMEAANEGIYSTNSYRGVTATPYNLSDYLPFAIGRVEIKINDETNFLNDNHQQLITVSDIQQQVRKALKNEVITRNKTLLLNLPQGFFKVTINAIHPLKGFSATGHTHGILLPNTKFTVVPHLSANVVLIDKIYREEVERVDFQLSTVKRSQFASFDTHPIRVSREEINREIRARFENSAIAKGAEFTIHHPSGWDIIVKFSEGIVAENTIVKDKRSLFDYSQGFVLSKETSIRLKTSSSILLSKSESKPAQKITFKIADMPGKQSVDIDHSKERWLSLMELKQEILKLDHPFAVGETFEIALTSGNFYIEVRKAQGVEGEKEQLRKRNTEQLWSVGEDSDVQFTIEKELNVNLLKDDSVHPLKRAYIQLKAEKIPDTGLKITLDQLKRLALTQAPERLVDNHTFSVLTEESDRLEFKVTRTAFDDTVGKTENVSVFGVLSGDTHIEFSTLSAENLTLVEKVHSEDLQAMRFSMYVTKQEDVAKHQRPPIIMDRIELTQMIRKELAKYPYITEGFSKTFQLENGWDIEITFYKGLLKKSDPRNQSAQVNSSNCQKDAYAIKEETEILLVGGNRRIALTQGNPVDTGRAHLEITDVKEDYTTQDTSLEKGAWINVDKLKEELLARGHNLVIGEKILIELESGKYIIEVKSAKPANRKAKLPKKRKEAIWALTENTKINVTISSGIDLITVSDGTVYPLEKIKFITYPKVKGEHISIKEEEIRDALMEDLPNRLIQGQIFELETISNHTLLVNVEEVQLKDDSTFIDKKKIFTAITPETKVIFRGKEKTNIAVRSEPKVLEVDDPIAYLESLGMAGIDKEFEQVFRIFYSRSDRLIEEARRRGTKPIKGILLYGPPGTGKTTLARHVGEMLGCSGKRLQLNTATELFNMWFGKSEQNIRELFGPAREALEKYGDKSPLYVVIIDEIDALLPKRGGSTNKVHDSLVNQFLGEIDGLNELNNLLVIGLTNRREEIDPAALRHGRLGVHIEIGLPDKKARSKIFEVHTRKLKKEGLLHESVNLELLAEKTDKLPGAAIEGIVESASLFSLARLNKLKCPKEELRIHPDGLITMKDFEKALKEQVKENETPDSIRRMYI